MTEIAANDNYFTSTCDSVETIKSTYQSFLPGESCESIYSFMEITEYFFVFCS